MVLTKIITEERGVMEDYSEEEVVWCDLGRSYGWWPAQVQDPSQRAVLSHHIIASLGETFSQTPSTFRTEKEDVLFIRFFDDDSKEWMGVSEAKRIKKYSCKEKKKLIRKGFKTLDESKRKGGLGGVNLRLAQFYKDVEMAEVLTDNDPQVADILALYEITENQEENQGEEGETEAGNFEGSAGSACEEKEKDVLREIKNGRVKRRKGVGRRRKSRK